MPVPDIRERAGLAFTHLFDLAINGEGKGERQDQRDPDRQFAEAGCLQGRREVIVNAPP